MKLVAMVLVTCGILVPQASPGKDGNNHIASLATSEKFMPLTETAAISLNNSTSITLEPGVRAKKVEGGYSLSTLDGSRLEIETSVGKMSLLSPVMINVTGSDVDLAGGKSIAASNVFARRTLQDDTDTNLKSMQESAKKLKTQSNNQDASQQPTKKLKHRWLFGENPNPTAELFNQAAIQQLTHLSPIGF